MSASAGRCCQCHQGRQRRRAWELGGRGERRIWRRCRRRGSLRRGACLDRARVVGRRQGWDRRGGWTSSAGRLGPAPVHTAPRQLDGVVFRGPGARGTVNEWEVQYTGWSIDRIRLLLLVGGEVDERTTTRTHRALVAHSSPSRTSRCPPKALVTHSARRGSPSIAQRTGSVRRFSVLRKLSACRT